MFRGRQIFWQTGFREFLQIRVDDLNAKKNYTLSLNDKPNIMQSKKGIFC